MELLKRIAGAYLGLTALAAVILLIITPLTHDGSPEYPYWVILNWFLAVGVVITLIVSYLRRREAANAGPESIYSFRTSIMFGLAVVLTMLFYWGWFWTLNPESETGDAVTSHLVYFPIVDALYVMLGISAARYLVRGDG